MKKYFLFTLFLAGLTASSFKRPQAKITVAVAANMQYAFKALQADFEQSSGVRVEVVIGSSGKLTQQITEGAPFDVFVSADTKYPQTLYQNKLAADTPRVYANGVLVLWSTKPGVRPAASLGMLLGPDVKAIAIANPATAPYGAAAEEILNNYHLLDKLRPKLVYGESITQTSQFIATGAADIGFTAKAVVVSDEMKGKGQWVELDAKKYTPISQAAVLLNHGLQTNPQAAKVFYAYLYTGRAKKILKQFGYLVR